MKSTDRTILLGVLVLGLAAAFWFFVLAPKRQEAADLQTQVTELEGQVIEAEQAAAVGQQAKQDFPSNYRKLVTLGKAVPVDADTPSLLTQLQTLSVRSDVDFRSITLSAGGSSAAPAAPAAPADPAAASEAVVATLPIGATVGTAGLPVMPYQMEFEGGFFEIADFFGRIDGMVDSHGDTTSVNGRLLTIDGFNFAPGPAGLPGLTANVTATSYLTPVDQGITAGATPAGPAEATPVPATTPAPGTTPDPAVSAAVVAN
jgi:hypothetical protein